MPSINRLISRFALAASVALAFGFEASVPIQGMAKMSLTRSRAADSHQDPNAREFTTRPLRDWLTRTNELRSRGLINSDANFEFAIDAKRNAYCGLSDVAVVQKSGDQRFFEVMRDLMAAISDSGLMMYLADGQEPSQRCSSIPFRFNFKSDSGELSGSVAYMANSSERAIQISRGYNLLITTGKMAKRGYPDELIFNAMNATSEGSQIILQFRMSRTNIEEILRAIQSR